MGRVIDTVGGAALTKIFAQTKPGGIVAACGNAGGIKLYQRDAFYYKRREIMGYRSSGSSIKRREFIWGEAAKQLISLRFNHLLKSFRLLNF